MLDAPKPSVDAVHRSRSGRVGRVSKDRHVKLEGRWRLLLLATAAFAALSLLGALTADASGGWPPSLGTAQAAKRPRSSRRKTKSRRVTRDIRKARLRRRALNAPRARAQRLASRTAFHGIAAPAARRLLSADYGHVLSGISANPAASIASQGKVIHYLNDFTAQVRTSTGFEVESSTAPLRVATGSGKKLPVNLELESTDGHIEPRRPLAPVVIGGHAEGGVSLTGSGISLTMLGANSPATVVEGKEALYSEVGTDVDAVAVPKLNGVDLSALIRSADSPEVLRYRVGVPLGARLVAEDGGAAIQRGNDTLARIPAPWARDAQGTLVPAGMQVHGDELVVRVAHREGSYAYPILVDPELLEDITETSEGWEYHATTRYKYIGHQGGEHPAPYAYEGAPVTHSGPGGESGLSMSITPTGLPFEVPTEDSPEEQEGWLATELTARQLWNPDPYGPQIYSIAFDGISASGASGPDIYSQVQLHACVQTKEWSAAEAIPTDVVFAYPFNELYNCNSIRTESAEWYPAPVWVEVFSGTPIEWEREEGGVLIPGEQATAEATVSVAAIVVARAMTWQEEQELHLANAETYGNGNPAELTNTDCTAGDPVNCATGNLTESQEDLSVGGVGPGLHADRSYNSQLAATQKEPGRFGFGWTASYEDRIDVEESCIANCEEVVTSNAVSALDGEGGSEEEGSEGLVAAYSLGEDKETAVEPSEEPVALSAPAAGSLLAVDSLGAQAIDTAYEEPGGGYEGAQATSSRAIPSGPEIAADRSATSRTFRLPSGKLETRLYGAPVNYQATKGTWKPIREGLREAAGATLTNGPNDFRARLPKQIDSGTTRLSHGGQWVATELLGSEAGSVRLKGGTASYEGSNASFRYSGLSDGLKEKIELTSALAPSTYSFELSASSGLAPHLEAGGALVFRDKSGQVAFTLPPPTMADSAPHPAVSRAVRYELGPEHEGHWRLTVRANREWIADPHHAFPVTIDPTMVVGPPFGCVIGGHPGETGWIDCDTWGREIYLIGNGEQPNSAEDELWRTLMNFETEAIPPSAEIASATFHIYSPEATQNTEGVELRKITKPWTWRASWSQYDGPEHLWENEGGDYSDHLGEVLTAQRGSQAGWWEFTMPTGDVEEAAAAEEELPVMMKLIDDKVRECGEESCVQRKAFFDSSTAADEEDRPYLSVVYSVRSHHGPVAAYSFDEGEGTTAHDDTGNGHEGTIEGAEWAEEGKFGSALEFNGKPEDCVTIPDSSELQLRGEFTLEAWIKPEGQGEDPVIFKEGGSVFGYALYYEEGHAEGALAAGPSEAVDLQGTETLPEGAWSDLAVSYDGEQMRIYVDGELVGTKETTGPIASEGPLHIGCSKNWGEGFEGEIDNVRVYDRALSAGELEEDGETAIQPPLPTAPIASYSFDEGEGEVAGDSIGGHDGSIQGAKWTSGKFGSALSFSSEEGDVVTVPSSPELELTEAFTVEAWVRPTESQQWSAIAFKEGAEGSLSYLLAAGGPEALVPEGIIFPGGEAEDAASATEALPVDTWSNLALTFDGEDLRLYVDGALVATATAAPPGGGSGALRIGPGFTGKIDELRIYDRALDAEEIQTDESTPIGTTEGSEEPEEESVEEEGEVWEQVAVVHQDNGSTAEFRRIEGEAAWMPVNPLVRAELSSEGEGLAYTLPDQTVLRFGSSGLLDAEEDRNGNAVTVSRDAEGRISSVGDESGRELVYSYDGEGFVESIEDPAGHVVHYEYEDGNLTGVSQPGSTEPRWQFGYDHDHELTSLTNGRGGVTKTKYQAFRAVRQEDPMGHVTSWSYAPEEEGSTTTITEPNGSETVEQFNQVGLISRLTRAAGTSLAATTTYEYNPADELTAVTNAEEQTTEFSYGPNGDKIGETDPEGNETTWTYNGAHEVTGETWPNGEETTISRDAHGNPDTVSRPAPEGKTQTQSFEYGPHGELESKTDPLGSIWTYGYDAHGDLESETDPEGDERTWAYDEDSRVISTVSPRGNVEGAEAAEFTTSIDRDPEGRPVRVTDPLGGTTEYAYDADGNLESVTDPNGNETRFTYDPDGERTDVERPSGAMKETGYDEAGQVVSLTHGGEGETTYVRNLLEEPVETIDPLGRATTRTFYKGGNLETETDPEGRTTTFSYDKANRLKEVSYSAEPGQDATYAYNKDGELTSMVDGTGTSTYEYDQLGLLVHSEDGNGETVGWEYNLADKPVGLTYPNGKSVGRSYDEAGRLEAVEDWLGNKTVFDFNTDSMLARTSFPAGTNEADLYAYDHADRLTGIEMTQGEADLASIAYARDPAGLVEATVAEGLPGPKEVEYAYDENSRLISAGTASFEYDEADNLTATPGGSFSYDGASQLESGSGLSYTYDNLGERTKAEPVTGTPTTYGYDQAGHLTSVERAGSGEAPAIKEQFEYDGQGRLASRSVSGETTHLTWDASTNPTTLLSDGQSSYIYGPDGEPVESVSGSETPTFYHHDQLGSTRMLTNAAGEVTATFAYGPYGELEGSTGGATTPLGYAGQYTDSETGFQYLRSRYYDPATGQFISRDPAIQVSGVAYGYAAGNPVNATDPSGLISASGVLGTIGEFLEPLNPIKYYEEEIEAVENGCSYWDAVIHGLEGAGVAAADATGLDSLIAGFAGFAGKEAAASVVEALSGLEAGSSANVFVVSSDAELQSVWDALSTEGTPVGWEGYDGDVVRLPNGTEIGIRGTSRSGGPVIDINQPGEPPVKIHVSQ